MFSNPCLFSNDMLAKAQTTFLWFPVFQPSSRRICFILKNDHQNLKKFKDSDHHELLDLVQSVEVSSPLQELAGGDEVAAAWFQARVKFFHYPLQRAKTPPLETGLQHTLEKHLIWALLRHAEKSRRQLKKHVLQNMSWHVQQWLNFCTCDTLDSLLLVQPFKGTDQSTACTARSFVCFVVTLKREASLNQSHTDPVYWTAWLILATEGW